VLRWEVVVGELGVTVLVGDHAGLITLGCGCGQEVLECVDRCFPDGLPPDLTPIGLRLGRNAAGKPVE
jgi:hypothetical protein